MITARYSIIVILVLLVTSSCTKRISVDSFTRGENKVCIFNFPRQYHISKYQSDDPNTEWKVEYQGRVVFISTNERDGSELNQNKYLKYGKDISIKFWLNP